MRTIQGNLIKTNTITLRVNGGTAGEVIFPRILVDTDGNFNLPIFSGLGNFNRALRTTITRPFIPISLTHQIFKEVAPDFSSTLLNQFTTPYLIPIIYPDTVTPKFEVVPNYYGYAFKISAQAFTNNNYVFVPPIPASIFETYIFQGDICLNNLSQLEFDDTDFLTPNNYIIVPTDQKSNYLNLRYAEGNKTDQYKNGLISRGNTGAGNTLQSYTFTYLTI